MATSGGFCGFRMTYGDAIVYQIGDGGALGDIDWHEFARQYVEEQLRERNADHDAVMLGLARDGDCEA